MKRIHFLRGVMALPTLPAIAVAVSEEWDRRRLAVMKLPLDMADIRVETFHALREITNKESGGWREYLEGVKSAKVFLEGNGVLTPQDFEDVASRDVIHIENLHGVTCDMYLERLEICSDGAEEPARWSATCFVTGVLKVDREKYIAHRQQVNVWQK